MSELARTCARKVVDECSVTRADGMPNEGCSFGSDESFSSLRSVSANSLLGYTLPKLHTGKSWYIDFLCFDPLEGKLKRKKYCLNSIKSKAERRARAAELVATLTARLRSGWNCWVATDSNNSRQYTTFGDVCDYYVRHLDKLLRSGVLRDTSHTRYLSYLRRFSAWVDGRTFDPIHYVYQLRQEALIDFLDFLFLDLDHSAVTRNNYLTWLGTFGEWLVSKRYLAANPAHGIPKIKEGAKKREQLTAPMLSQLRSYLLENDRHFLLAVMLEYYAFIRPNELTYVRIQDISIKEQKVHLAAAHTKNGRESVVGLNKQVLQLMVDLGTFNAPGSYYLFGASDFRPGANRRSPNMFRERWAKVRKALKWRDCYQFYSLKDTGLRDLANAVGVVIARDQARHADVSTTNKYLKGDSLTVHSETKDFVGGL